MNKLVRYWNQNRKDIIKIIAIIAFVLFIIQVTNNLLKQGKSYDKSEDDTTKYQPNQSVITGEKVQIKITEENNNIIKQFVDYCNSKEPQNAFNLLSDDCKTEYSNNINLFINNYYNRIFTNEKIYGIELWLCESDYYTYRIKYYENNLLATGGSNLKDNIEDYITVVKQNGEDKININGFIKKQDINKKQESNGIKITINNKKVYKDYEKYDISIENNISNTITISDGNNDKDICLIDRNNVKYPCFLGELSIYELSLKAGQKRNKDIKFNKIYDLYRYVEKVQFNCINVNTNSQERIIVSIDI